MATESLTQGVGKAESVEHEAAGNVDRPAESSETVIEGKVWKEIRCTRVLQLREHVATWNIKADSAVVA